MAKYYEVHCPSSIRGGFGTRRFLTDESAIPQNAIAVRKIDADLSGRKVTYLATPEPWNYRGGVVMSLSEVYRRAKEAAYNRGFLFYLQWQAKNLIQGYHRLRGQARIDPDRLVLLHDDKAFRTVPYDPTTMQDVKRAPARRDLRFNMPGRSGLGRWGAQPALGS